ncbi:MAG TPA: Ger(x)C family spore germination protein [Bacillota bacterium]|nr:Ger(x)C family spore germination protein [Bacillota bacterium]
MKAVKRLSLAAVMLLCVLLITGCWDKVEIEDRLFALAIGVDDVKEEERKTSEDMYTFSFVAPVLEEMKKESKGPAFRTYEAVSCGIIHSQSQLLERFSQKQYFGLTRVMLFGEGMMRDEKLLKEIIDAILRYHELHNSMYAYIVPGRAEEVFEVKPKFEKLIMRYIAGITENSSYSSGILKLSLSDAIIMLINNKGGLVIPRLIPGEEEIRVSGAGVLKEYRLVGYLDDSEVSSYNRLMDKAKGGSFPVDIEGTSTVFKHFRFDRSIELSKVEGGKIYLNYNMETEGTIEEYTLNKIMLDNKFLKKVEHELGKKIESESEKLIKRFQKEFRTDLIGARDYLNKYQPKLFKTIEKDYDKYFSDNIVIKVNADVHIRRIGLIK